MAKREDVVEKVRSALESRNYRAFAECFDANGVYERPFALKGTPDRYEGVEKIYQYIETGMAAANKLFEINRLEATVHLCVDERLVFVEFFLSGHPVKGESFRIASSVALITCEGDKIMVYRDFANSAGIAQAAGMLERYASGLVRP